jgi:hypothetical protein
MMELEARAYWDLEVLTRCFVKRKKACFLESAL